MIKILQYAPGFLHGGIESRMLDWYRNMDRDEVQFVLVKLNAQDDTPELSEFVALGGKVYDLPPFNIKSAFSFEKEIVRIIEAEKIDILHTHNSTSGLFVLRAAKKCGIPCRIFHSRTTAFLPDERNVAVKRFLMKRSPKYVTDFWACSKEAGLWGCGEKYYDRVSVINNGIQDDLFVFDLKKRESIRKELGLTDRKVIGCVCRLSGQKNLPFLLDIMSELVASDRDYRLLLVGSGDAGILEDYYSGKNDISQYVVTTGMKKNVWDYYMAMDIFCGTSLYEGFGTTAIESQATGLPTLLSTAFPETVMITDFVRRLETADTDPWIKAIHEFEGRRYPAEGIAGVVNNGFSAPVVARQIEEFYLAHAKAGN